MYVCVATNGAGSPFRHCYGYGPASHRQSQSWACSFYILQVLDGLFTQKHIRTRYVHSTEQTHTCPVCSWMCDSTHSHTHTPIRHIQSLFINKVAGRHLVGENRTENNFTNTNKNPHTPLHSISIRHVYHLGCSRTRVDVRSGVLPSLVYVDLFWLHK